jgi:hypothetical protein
VRKSRARRPARAQLPPNSGFNPVVVADILDMIDDVLGPASWQAVLIGTSGGTLSATYVIAEPEIGGFNERIRAQSPSGSPEFELDRSARSGQRQRTGAITCALGIAP